jgi:uncharacterized protein
MQNWLWSAYTFSLLPENQKMKLPSFVAIACSALAITAAQSAAIDCTQATTPTDKAICQDKDLGDLDKALSSVYGRLLRLPPALKKELVQSQKRWLTQRNTCQDKLACLQDSYRQRIEALSGQLKSIEAYKPDAALAQLRSAVESAMQQDAEFPLEKAIGAFVVKDGTTDFSNQAADGKDATPRFPVARPQGVTQDEWAALERSGIEAEGENGAGAYTLMDVDGDGQRDLIINTYVGGTGLFNYISVAKRTSNRFAQDNSVYSLNGRGANQRAYWVRLQGRVYAAYRNSYYGEDQVFLLRPLEVNGKVPTLTIRYRYSLTVPGEQALESPSSGQGKPQKRSLDVATHRALQAAVAKASRVAVSQDRKPVDSEEPMCPIPAGTAEDQQGDYMGFGPGHYSFEIVANMPIWINKACHVAQLINWFGGYSAKEGLQAMLWVKRPGQSDKQVTYGIEGRRQAVKVENGMAVFESE